MAGLCAGFGTALRAGGAPPLYPAFVIPGTIVPLASQRELRPLRTSPGLFAARGCMMRLVPFAIIVLLGLGMLLSPSGGSAAAQEVSCAPVAVGEGTGVFFLATGDSCSSDQADGYTV